MPGLIRGVARTAVIAGTATTVSNSVSRRQAEPLGRAGAAAGAQQPAAVRRAAAAAGRAPAADMDDKLAQLKELGALKEAGVLNEYEFEQQKNRILNG